MSAQLLAGKPVADVLYTNIGRLIESFKKQKGRPPTLATVLVGEDPASQVYVRKKGEMCTTLGLGHRDYKKPASIFQDDLKQLINELNEDSTVDGILVQKPLPKHINDAEIFDIIHPSKDVDCFSPHNVGLLSQGRGYLMPCTPAGVMEILKHYKISPQGMNALVVGRSDIVGKPMGLLLLHANATVTYAHSRTKDLAQHIAQADLVIAALGKAKFLNGDLPWKSSAIVIDVGINRLHSGKLAGDVDFETVAPKVAAITPVPGGVGPMTIAMLMVNTVQAAFVREGLANKAPSCGF